MKSLILLGFCLWIPFSANATENPLACVDPDIAANFVQTRFGNELQISTAPPTLLANLELPAEIEFVGSANSDYGVVARYKSPLPVSAARDKLVAALTSIGWQQISAIPGNSGSATIGGKNRTLCHHDHGFVSVGASLSRGTTYADIGVIESHGGSDACSLQRELTRIATDDYERMSEFTLPDCAKEIRPGISMKSLPSGLARATIESDLTMTELTSYFESMLSKQGWTRDTKWMDRRFAGISVEREVMDDIFQAGLLTILMVADATYNVEFDFRILAAPEAVQFMYRQTEWSNR